MKGKKLNARDRKTLIESCADERRKIFKELLQHVREGKSLSCFSALSEDSIRKYLKEYHNEFVQEDLEVALREAQDLWETIGKDQSIGKCMGNSRSWYYNMSNRYGWSERSKQEVDTKGQVNVSIVSYASTKQAHHSDA